MSIATISPAAKPTPRYMSLVRKFPLRPIQSAKDLDAASAILDKLFPTDDKISRDPGELDYVNALIILISEYEDKHCPLEEITRGITPLDVLKHLMEANEMSQAELAKILDIGRPAVSMILSGTRPITADHARALGKRFAVDPGAFL